MLVISQIRYSNLVPQCLIFHMTRVDLHLDLGNCDFAAYLHLLLLVNIFKVEVDEVKKYQSHHAKQKKFKKQLLHLIVRSKRSISIVEDKELVETLHCSALESYPSPIGQRYNKVLPASVVNIVTVARSTEGV